MSLRRGSDGSGSKRGSSTPWDCRSLFFECKKCGIQLGSATHQYTEEQDFEYDGMSQDSRWMTTLHCRQSSGIHSWWLPSTALFSVEVSSFRVSACGLKRASASAEASAEASARLCTCDVATPAGEATKHAHVSASAEASAGTQHFHTYCIFL